jgi:uncharacterized protein YkwD
VSLLLAAVLAASTALTGATAASATTTREARMLAKINSARANHGLTPVTLSSDLMSVAKSHTWSMVGTSALFHTTSFSALCCWESMAENVGYGFSVRGLHRRLMKSAPHRANILDPAIRQVGIGIVESGGALWVTELFRDPR